MQELVETLDGWRAEGAGIGRAVVVRTFGSAPRPEGAVLLVTDDGRIAGSVSGGDVERAVEAVWGGGSRRPRREQLFRPLEKGCLRARHPLRHQRRAGVGCRP